MFLLNLAYTIFLIFQRKRVSIGYGVIALISYLMYVYLYLYNVDEIIPFSIPQWMINENAFIYVGTFLMPTLCYALFAIVIHLTNARKKQSAGLNFLYTILIPPIAYLFFQVILPMAKGVNYAFSDHVYTVLYIVFLVVFLFFLMRTIIILFFNKSKKWSKFEYLWKIPITLVLPIFGLLLNNGVIGSLTYMNAGVFGDFSNVWFYIFTIVNAIVLCFPKSKNKTVRVVFFALSSITFTYTIYFFLVFLPYLPISVIAIIAFGAGFLMLTPLLLFFLHVSDLRKDFVFLSTAYSKKKLLISSFVLMLIVPMCIHLKFAKDKAVFHSALDYLYAPDYSKNYQLDIASLSKTMGVIKSNRKRDYSIFGASSKIPYISSYFKWFVLDNLTISNSKIRTIDAVFQGKPLYPNTNFNSKDPNVEIIDVISTSKYDSTQNAWISWIDLEIEHKGISVQGEYETIIDLPTGCWISDYYLYGEIERNMEY